MNQAFIAATRLLANYLVRYQEVPLICDVCGKEVGRTPSSKRINLFTEGDAGPNPDIICPACAYSWFEEQEEQ